MTQAVVDLDPMTGRVLLLVAGGVLRHPQRLDGRGGVDHLLGSVNLACQVHTGQVREPSLGVLEGLTHERECLGELIDHVF